MPAGRYGLSSAAAEHQEKTIMRIAFLGVFLLVAASCGGGRPASGPQVGPLTQRSSIQVATIENGTSSDLRVFALYRTSQVLLGTARAQRSTPLTVFDVPPNTVFRLIGRPIGAATGEREYVSETIQLAAGQRLTWRLRSIGTGMIEYGDRP
jgi:hypothetical protein